ncbi:MAG TPA: hypothetical protein VFF60_03235, partial [Candidatus Binatus sp.]|nr:hypothetical protein [Candidatus Binatus sp.]
ATVGSGVTGNGAYWRGGSVYGPYGGIRGGSVYNPNTGNWYRGGVACSGGNCQRWGQGGNINNRPSPYSNWGNAARQPNINTPGQRPTTGNIGGNRPGGGNAGAGPGVSNPIAGNRPGGGPGISTNDNVFAGRDGNIYKPTADGGWSRYNNANQNWQNVNTGNIGANRPTAGTQPSINRPTTTTQPAMNSSTYNNLNRSNYARSAGASNFGGMRGGGGFRGGRGR